MKTKSTTIMIAIATAVTLMACSTRAFAGALFTTDLNCHKVNGNIYDTKQNVWLNGGPDGSGSALEVNTTYCILVSAPGGTRALNTIECRKTTDSTGHFACFNLFECTGFDDTDNPGGEYKVEACPLESGVCVFRPISQCKSDNFKVRSTIPPGCQTVCISCPENIIDVPCTTLNGACVVVNYPAPIVTGPLAGSATVSCTPASGSCFNAGATTTVTCTATSGTDTANCSFSVTVNSCPHCELTCPTVTAVCNEPGVCGAHVNWLPPSCPDAPGATVLCDHQPGDFYPVGTTTVTCTANQGGGTIQCSFVITVNDCENPTITCPTAPITVTAASCATCANVTYTVTASDNCGTVTPSCTPPSGSSFCQGTTTVNCSVTTGGTVGHTTATCSFTVTVQARDCGGLTMGFWQNKNGQGIIYSCGGTGLPTFLTSYNPFKDLSATATPSQVTNYVYTIIKAANASGASMNAMLKAQMLATALDVYFTTTGAANTCSKLAATNLGGQKIDLTKVCKMIDSSSGTATCGGIPLNTSSAFGGLACPNSTVNALLSYAASQSNVGGTLWYGNNVKATQELAKNTFDAINNGAAILCAP